MTDKKSSAMAKQSEIIKLADLSPLSSGMERVCYIHPNDPNLVIKVPQSYTKKSRRANDDEMRGYLLLKADNIDLSFISHCHGFIDTDRGKGLICDCIRDDSGEISKTIWDLVVVAESCDLQSIVEELNNLCTFLLENRVYIFDLNLKNIALKQMSNGRLKPYIIDLKGRYATNEYIPFSRLIPFLAMKKLERRISQLLERVPDFRRRRVEILKRKAQTQR